MRKKDSRPSFQGGVAPPPTATAPRLTTLSKRYGTRSRLHARNRPRRFQRQTLGARNGEKEADICQVQSSSSAWTESSSPPQPSTTSSNVDSRLFPSEHNEENAPFLQNLEESREAPSWSQILLSQVLPEMTQDQVLSFQTLEKSAGATEGLPGHHGSFSPTGPDAAQAGYQCAVCHEEFGSRSDLARHQVSPPTQTGYVCGECGRAASCCREFLLHQLQHKAASSGQPREDVVWQESLPAPSRPPHPDSTSSVQGKDSSRFAAFGSSMEHYVVAEKSSGASMRKEASCSVCGKSCKNSYLLLRHLFTHTDLKVLHCSICTKTFSSREKLRRHVLNHKRRKLHSCDICSKSFASAYTLSRHMRIHRRSKDHNCSVCGEVFVSKHNLKKHKLTHSQQLKKHCCDICLKEFAHRRSLLRHMSSHSEQLKKHCCDVCSKKFAHRRSLLRHMSSHSEQLKKHCCDVCSKEFAHRGSLLRHRVVHGERILYPCTICGKTFGQRPKLTRHLQIHTLRKRHPCTVCGKTFLTEWYLSRHAMKHSV